MKKSFLDNLDGGWDDVIADVYTDANAFKVEYSFDENGRKVLDKQYTNDDIPIDSKLKLDDDLYFIDSYIFNRCSNLIGDLVIPNSVELLKYGIFYNCTGFSGNLIISNSARYLGEASFYNCTGFIGRLVIPNSVNCIGSCTFRNCIGFTGDLRIPDSVNYIDSWAFDECGFNKIYIPKDKYKNWNPDWNRGCKAEIIKY